MVKIVVVYALIWPIKNAFTHSRNRLHSCPHSQAIEGVSRVLHQKIVAFCRTRKVSLFNTHNTTSPNLHFSFSLCHYAMLVHYNPNLSQSQAPKEMILTKNHNTPRKQNDFPNCRPPWVIAWWVTKLQWALYRVQFRNPRRWCSLFGWNPCCATSNWCYLTIYFVQCASFFIYMEMNFIYFYVNCVVNVTNFQGNSTTPNSSGKTESKVREHLYCDI